VPEPTVLYRGKVKGIIKADRPTKALKPAFLP
jgi:hypothetical protein